MYKTLKVDTILQYSIHTLDPTVALVDKDYKTINKVNKVHKFVADHILLLTTQNTPCIHQLGHQALSDEIF